MYNAQDCDEMVECPYNKLHRMLRKRLQSHLIKCRLSYPDAVLQKCPFNQTHLIPEPEFVHHVTNCSDRKLITQYKYDAPASDDEQRVKHEPIECDENWDDMEAEDYDPRKYVEKARVLRKIDGGQPAERKALVKEERKRLGDYDTDDEEAKRIDLKKRDIDRPHSSDEEKDYVLVQQRPKTPPPPRNISWSVEEGAYKGDANKEQTQNRREHPYIKPQFKSNAKQDYQGTSASKPWRENAHKMDDDPYYASADAVSNQSGFRRSDDANKKPQTQNRREHPYIKPQFKNNAKQDPQGATTNKPCRENAHEMDDPYYTGVDAVSIQGGVRRSNHLSSRGAHRGGFSPGFAFHKKPFYDLGEFLNN